MTSISFVLDGRDTSVPATAGSLLDALRDHLGRRSAKDGCSPQGQCGCCTVWIDGHPRVACVTPLARVAGRTVTTLDGVDPAVRDRWATSFIATGASQCGFCTPGILMRLAAIAPAQRTRAAIDRALAAHLCRCTGWQTIVEAALTVDAGPAAVAGVHGASGTASVPAPGPVPDTATDAAALGTVIDVACSPAPDTAADAAALGTVIDVACSPAPDTATDAAALGTVIDVACSPVPDTAADAVSGSVPGSAPGTVTDPLDVAAVGGGIGRSMHRAALRATIEGRSSQSVGVDVALGGGGFSEDIAPRDALVAVLGGDGRWVVGETLAAARAAAGRVQGRRTTEPVTWPLEIPPGTWERTLRTTWVEPAYLEPDAAWCAPGGEPSSPLANGGAFGAKASSIVADAARRLAGEHGRAVRAVLAREDVVRLGPKRPPVAIGIAADGTGVIRMVPGAGTESVAEVLAAVAPGLRLEQVEVAGPPVSGALRAVGWAEAAVALSSLRPEGPDEVVSPEGAWASARLDADGVVHVRVRCGAVLDDVVLRSYCIGAAHMALGWVRSEGIALDAGGVPLDLTIRSFGILRASEMPPVTVEILVDEAPPVNGSDAVFAAVAAAAWRHAGHPPRWPLASLA